MEWKDGLRQFKWIFVTEACTRRGMRLKLKSTTPTPKPHVLGRLPSAVAPFLLAIPPPTLDPAPSPRCNARSAKNPD